MPHDNLPLIASDKQLLKSWLQPQHLEDAQIKNYRKKFTDNSNSILSVPDFLQPTYADMIAAFMLNEAVYTKSYGLYSKNPASRSDWQKGSTADKFYKFSKITDAKQQTTTMNAFVYIKLLSLLKQQAFINYFNTITAISISELQGQAYGHAFNRGDFLKPHTDLSDNRKLAFILYLNPDWKPEYGGNFHFIDNHDQEIVFQYQFNCLMIFDVTKHKKHLISTIKQCAGDKPRLSIGGWYR